MTTSFAILALGFLLGMRHATDADHVVAVSTIVARTRRAGLAAWIGALWGVGHTLTILLVGGGIILFQWVIPPRLGLSMEFAVGLMLILLGITNLSGILSTIRERAEEPHDYSVDWLDRRLGRIGFYQAARPLLVGIVHGLAGSAAVGLLVLTTIKDPAGAILYLLLFGLGTIAGMMLITAAIALPVSWSAALAPRWSSGLRIASGVLSLGFGLLIAWQTGVTNGLFTGHPSWTPH